MMMTIMTVGGSKWKTIGHQESLTHDDHDDDHDDFDDDHDDDHVDDHDDDHDDSWRLKMRDVRSSGFTHSQPTLQFKPSSTDFRH